MAGRLNVEDFFDEIVNGSGESDIDVAGMNYSDSSEEGKLIGESNFGESIILFHSYFISFLFYFIFIIYFIFVHSS